MHARTSMRPRLLRYGRVCPRLVPLLHIQYGGELQKASE
jgi:hypothetical protein